MPSVLELLRWVHIGAGFAALVLMWVPIATRKGSRVHRTFGWAYVVSMFLVSGTAMLIVPIRISAAERSGYDLGDPQVYFPLFLGYIAILALATALYGVRVLRQKRRTGPHRDPVDLAIPAALVIASAAMIALGIVLGVLLLSLFPLIGLALGFTQLLSLQRAPTDPHFWMYEHLGGMLGSGIATVTAFLVVNAGNVERLLGVGIPPLLFWLAPTFVGAPMIAAWTNIYRRRMSYRRSPTGW